MEEKNKLTDDVRAVPEQGSGSLLAAERKRQNKTVEEVAAQLNLSVTQIRTIELDQSEGLPEPTYVRGYIRSYAKLLELDSEEVLAHYLHPNWQKGSRLDGLPKGLGNASTGDSRGFFSLGKLLFIAAIVGITVFMWMTGRLDGLLGKQAAPVAASIQSSGAVPSSGSSTQVTSSPVQNVTNDAASDAAVVGSDSDENSEQADELNADAVEAAGHELVLNFSDTSWIDIRDADGKRLAYKSYAGGEELVVSSQIPMSVFIGNAKAVTATYNGAAFDLTAHREGVFARFSLGE
ncbi:RodZ domain-containing protein [Arenicella xantha]|uniref:Cytoskeletal protein RodZ n=1 Tax=Arenicella xantha TaxID=644221 RepID=A0A395JH45_9GAMM|nr:RodZ domain-containing protein [Arenicella xantha]RBP49290.1 cytoskeletal protein RodZ [Arenicella xantha]